MVVTHKDLGSPEEKGINLKFKKGNTYRMYSIKGYFLLIDVN